MDENTELLLWKCLRRILWNQKWIIMSTKIDSKTPTRDTSKLIDKCDERICGLLCKETKKG